MKKTFWAGLAITAAVGLSGCGLPGTFGAESFIDDETVGGTSFAGELAQAYQQRTADAAANDVNWILAGRYAQKGRAAAAGNPPEPWNPADYYESPTFSSGVNSERAQAFALADRRVRLVNALANFKDIHPKACAQAQSHYDWLVDEVYQDTPPTDAAGQKKIAVAFERVLAQCVNTPTPAPKPVPVAHQAPKVDNRYVLYFGWNRYNLTDEARKVINLAVQNAAGRALNVLGYTDTSGSDAYNDKLSQKRAGVTAQALKQGNAAVQSVGGRGEHDLAKTTADGVREPLNRRAVIEVN